MFDEHKIKELENKSHVRGKLNKQFYSAEQQELQKKRRQMKYILDQQVQEKRRQKQRERLEQERKVQQEQQKIKAYYAQLQQRQKKPQASNNNSNHIPNQSPSQPKNYQVSKSNGSGMYDSRAVVHENSNHYGYYSKQNVNQSINRSKSRTQHEYDSGDIPVMPLMQSPQRDKQKQRNNQSLQSGNSSQHQNQKQKANHRNSAGNIPLLALTLEQQKREKKKSKRNPTKRDEKQKQKQKPRQKQRKQTFADQQYIQGNSRQQTQLKQQVFGDLNQQLEEENKQLKKQLKKRQEAISLLMGAVRSNAKLDKFRVQAERILHGQNSVDAKPIPMSQVQSRARKNSNKDGYQMEDDKKQKQSMLPKLKLHHQSIMHDYMFGSARRAHILKAKTFK